MRSVLILVLLGAFMPACAMEAVDDPAVITAWQQDHGDRCGCGPTFFPVCFLGGDRSYDPESVAGLCEPYGSSYDFDDERLQAECAQPGVRVVDIVHCQSRD